MVAKAYICHKTTRLAGACTNLDTIVNNSHVRNTLLEIVVPRDSARLGSTWLGLAWRFAREHAGISRGRLDPRRGIKNRHNGPLCVCLFARRFGDGVVRRCVGMSSLWNEFHRRFSGSAQCVICCGLRKRPPSKKWTALQGWPARATRYVAPLASTLFVLQSAEIYRDCVCRGSMYFITQLNLSRRLGNIIALQRRVLYLYYYQENVFRNVPCYMLSWERWWFSCISVMCIYMCVCVWRYHFYIFRIIIFYLLLFLIQCFLFLWFVARKWNL